MAVKSSGTLGLVADVVAEFGGSSPYALTDYYRGGSLVPDIGANSGVPASGTIALTDFYGAEATTPGPTLTARAGTFNNTDSGASAQAIRFDLFYDSDGDTRRTLETSGSFATASIGAWSDDAAEDGTGLYLRVSYVSGDNTYSSGSGLGVWLLLTSNRNFRFEDTLSPFSTASGTYTVELSDDGGTTVASSATLVVNLEHLGN